MLTISIIELLSHIIPVNEFQVLQPYMVIAFINDKQINMSLSQ